MEHCQLSWRMEGKFRKLLPGCSSGLGGSEVAHSYTQAQEEGRATLPCALNEESSDSFTSMGGAPGSLTGLAEETPVEPGLEGRLRRPGDEGVKTVEENLDPSRSHPLTQLRGRRYSS